MYATETALLAMAGVPTRSEFLELVGENALPLHRVSGRVLRTRKMQNGKEYTNLAVVEASPSFTVPMLEPSPVFDRYIDSNAYADSAGICPCKLEDLGPNSCGSGFWLTVGNRKYEVSGGLCLLKVSTCIPKNDGGLTFLRFGGVVDVMGSKTFEKRIDVALLVPLGQFLLSNLTSGDRAIFHLTSMDETDDLLTFQAQAVFRASADTTAAEWDNHIKNFRGEMEAAVGVLQTRRSLKRKHQRIEDEAAVVQSVFTPTKYRKADSLGSPATSVSPLT